MKYCMWLAIICLWRPSLAQKKQPIDFTAIEKWQNVQNAEISDNGKYASYLLKQSYEDYKPTLIVVDLAKNIQKKFERCSWSKFSTNSNYLIYGTSGDSLSVCELKNWRSQTFDSILSSRVEGDYIFYTTKAQPQNLEIYNFVKNSRRLLKCVRSFSVNADGTKLVYELLSSNQTHTRNILRYKDLLTDKEFDLKSNICIENPDKDILWSAWNICFRLVEDSTQVQLVVYDILRKNLKPILTQHDIAGDTNLKIGAIKKFDLQSYELYFDLVLTKEKNPSITPDLKVWNYKDETISSKDSPLRSQVTYVGSVNARTGRYKKLQGDEESSPSVIRQGKQNSRFAVSITNFRIKNEKFWDDSLQQDVKLISLKTGEIRKVFSTRAPMTFNISPDLDILTYYSPEDNNIYTYDIKKDTIYCLTKKLNGKWAMNLARPLDNKVYEVPPRWLKGGRFLILTDAYDLWLVDSMNESSPICLTSGMAKKNSLKFQLSSLYTENDIFGFGDNIILTVFDKLTKENGFYRLKLSQHNFSKMEKLAFGPYALDLINIPGLPDGVGSGIKKAKMADRFVLKTMNSESSPNFQISDDLVHFHQLSRIAPEKKYNWMKAELHQVVMKDGQKIQGVLYKPENFDATKKYPLIFHYYERKSDGLNVFLTPKLSSDMINIPLFVSNGYLVFTPDLPLEIGRPGESGLHGIMAFVAKFTALPYVDSTKLGLQGASFSGFLTNYFVGHTNKFRAACSASSITDIVNSYSSVGSGGDLILDHEKGQLRMGGSLWDNLDSYLANSPILAANNIKTPLLMMHTDDDRLKIATAQAFFAGLRRLKKPVWLLEYRNEDHGLNNPINKLDYTRRMQEFFDHYLKDAPAPEWMTQGTKIK